MILIDATKKHVEMKSLQYLRCQSAAVDYNWPKVQHSARPAPTLDAMYSPRPNNNHTSKTMQYNPTTGSRKTMPTSARRKRTPRAQTTPSTSTPATTPPPPTPPPPQHTCDHLLKTTDNHKLQQWLRAKNRLAASARRHTRKEARQRHIDNKQASAEHQGRLERSVKATRDWLKRKREETRSLRRKELADINYENAKHQQLLHDSGTADQTMDDYGSLHAPLPHKNTKPGRVVSAGAIGRRLQSADRNLKHLKSSTTTASSTTITGDYRKTFAPLSDDAAAASGLSYHEWLRRKVDVEKSAAKHKHRKYTVIPDCEVTQGKADVEGGDLTPLEVEVSGDQLKIEVHTPRATASLTPATPTTPLPVSSSRVSVKQTKKIKAVRPLPQKSCSPTRSSLNGKPRASSGGGAGNSRSPLPRKPIVSGFTLDGDPSTVALKHTPAAAWNSFSDNVWTQVNKQDDDEEKQGGGGD